jgi:nickel-dependent lactate racemase
MNVAFKYGQGVREVSFPDKARVDILRPAHLPPLENLEAAFAAAMDAPADASPLEALPRPGTVAIAVPDETRPAPVKALLPLLLGRLYRAFPGLEPAQVTVVVAAGLHPPLDEEALRRVVPETIAPGVRVVSHDAALSPIHDYGRTSRRTPVRINRLFAAADLKLIIGTIDPHQFVGFTGGAKVAVIGCGAEETITANHALMFHDRAKVAQIEGNPVRLDIDEAGRMIGIPLVVNVVLDDEKRPVELLAGDPIAVCREGARTCAQLYGVAIEEPYDMAVASCGGHPKDITLYQAQKGLAHAAQAVRPGGKILLLAACPQGIGDAVYEAYVSRFRTPHEALDDFSRMGFKMGAHKSFLFGRTLVAYDVVVASDLDGEALRRCHLTAGDPRETVRRWIDAFAGRPRVAAIPNANTTYIYPT